MKYDVSNKSIMNTFQRNVSGMLDELVWKSVLGDKTILSPVSYNL